MRERRSRRRGVAALLLVTLSGCSFGPDPDRRTDFVLVLPDGVPALDQPAEVMIARVIRAARAAPELDVVVAGYAGEAGAPQAEQIADRIRAQLVADALVSGGVPRRRVDLKPRRALGATPAFERLRVEVRIGG